MYNRLVNKKRLILSLLLLLVASLFVPSHIVPSAHAQFTGLVCITASTTATSCPASPPSLGPFTPGQTFTVGVFISGSDAMGGFDIYVASNPAFVSPTSAALSTLIASPSLTSICVNGSAQTGSCTVGTANGPGAVEVTTIESSGSNECGGISPCSGMAIAITYQVVGATPNTSLSYPSAAGCSYSSVSSPSSVCVLVADNTGTALHENIQGATVTQTVTADPTSTSTSCSSPAVVGQSIACTETITDTATSGATVPIGTVTFTTDGSGSFVNGNGCTLSPIGPSQSSCSVTYLPGLVGTGIHIGANYPSDAAHSGSTASFPLTVSKATPSIVTWIIVAATLLPAPPSVALGTSIFDAALLGNSFPFYGFPVGGASGTVTYTLYSNGNCAGTGTVVSTVSAMSDNWLFSAPVTPPVGTYGFQAVYSGDGSNFAVTSACEPLAVTNFSLTATTTSLSVGSGGMGSDILTVTSLSGFTGSVTLTHGIVPSGATVTFVLNPVIVTTVGSSVTSTMTVFISSTISPGTSFTFTVTGTSGALSHSVSITVKVKPPPSLTKLSWTNHLSLSKSSNVQSWTATVTNPLSTSVSVVVRIVGASATNPANSFDITCGVTCVNTAGGDVNNTPGLTPVSVAAGAASFSFSFSQPISSSFVNQKISLTATLYWTNA